MTHANDNLERLIVRSLDNALTDDERLELDRELIRDPAAHRLHDEYRRIDSLAAEALHASLQTSVLTFDPASLSASTPRKQRWVVSRTWWLLPGAIAAALLAVMLARTSAPIPVESPDRGRLTLDDGRSRENPIAPRAYPALDTSHGGNGLLQTISTTPRIQRDTGREVIGVWGEDGNLYWLEIDRTRAYRRVPVGAGMGAVRETM